MNAQEHMRAECPEDYKAFLAAEAAGKKINGLSISGDEELLAEVEKLLDFEPTIAAAKAAKEKMLAHYRAKAVAGLCFGRYTDGMGDGVFLID